MNKLYYLTASAVKEVEYTRDRAMEGNFFENKREALIVLKERIEKEVQEGVTALMRIERELSADKSNLQ